MAQPLSVIDTDIHQVLNLRRMPDFLPEPFRSRFLSGDRGPGHLGYWNPNGVMRSDTKLPDGTKIESTPETLARHFFDVYGRVVTQYLCSAPHLSSGHKRRAVAGVVFPFKLPGRLVA